MSNDISKKQGEIVDWRAVAHKMLSDIAPLMLEHMVYDARVSKNEVQITIADKDYDCSDYKDPEKRQVMTKALLSDIWKSLEQDRKERPDFSYEHYIEEIRNHRKDVEKLLQEYRKGRDPMNPNATPPALENWDEVNLPSDFHHGLGPRSPHGSDKHQKRG